MQHTHQHQQCLLPSYCLCYTYVSTSISEVNILHLLMQHTHQHQQCLLPSYRLSYIHQHKSLLSITLRLTFTRPGFPGSVSVVHHCRASYILIWSDLLKSVSLPSVNSTFFQTNTDQSPSATRQLHMNDILLNEPTVLSAVCYNNELVTSHSKTNLLETRMWECCFWVSEQRQSSTKALSVGVSRFWLKIDWSWCDITEADPGSYCPLQKGNGLKVDW